MVNYTISGLEIEIEFLGINRARPDQAARQQEFRDVGDICYSYSQKDMERLAERIEQERFKENQLLEDEFETRTCDFRNVGEKVKQRSIQGGEQIYLLEKTLQGDEYLITGQGVKITPVFSKITRIEDKREKRVDKFLVQNGLKWYSLKIAKAQKVENDAR